MATLRLYEVHSRNLYLINDEIDQMYWVIHQKEEEVGVPHTHNGY